MRIEAFIYKARRVRMDGVESAIVNGDANGLAEMA
jgi:hypothetical protein